MSVMSFHGAKPLLQHAVSFGVLKIFGFFSIHVQVFPLRFWHRGCKLMILNRFMGWSIPVSENGVFLHIKVLHCSFYKPGSSLGVFLRNHLVGLGLEVFCTAMGRTVAFGRRRFDRGAVKMVAAASGRGRRSESFKPFQFFLLS
ncbi:unnamed protein product [Vicia faba]|uniref:Uncharacterized protein n=1 Tax=Vicia faba TaxID=3906 RepID=A0AAV0YGM7_VICFA|nr:unnamed protein product [Vicia faba]